MWAWNHHSTDQSVTRSDGNNKPDNMTKYIQNETLNDIKDSKN